MALFHTNKKETEPKACCCSGCDCQKQEETATSSVKVLGGGCKNCHKLQENTQEALQTLGMDTRVELVTDPAKIVAYGVMSTPALVVDETVVATGRVLTSQQAAEAIRGVRTAKG